MTIDQRVRRGATSHHNGLAAEDCAARHYANLGFPLVAKRWRGDSGELDLVFENGDGFVIVEVKSAKSHEQARSRFGAQQIQRVCQTAQQFIGDCPHGLNTEIRIDLATVDGTGQVETIENITLH